MKGIILAGGAGTRLYPLTNVLSKQLMPIYDKPMIYYPLGSLMGAGISEIAIISTPHDLPRFQKLLGNGSHLGLKFEYIVQPSPDGLAQAFILAEDFLNGASCCLILGDNVFYGEGLHRTFKESASSLDDGAVVFGYTVSDPERYGVLEFDKDGKVLSIEEKPEKPKSKWAIPGMYFYDDTVVERAKLLKPSRRGELEITDLNKLYIKDSALRVKPLGRGVAWLDTGTHKSLIEASEFVATVEHRQGLKIGCIEEIALNEGFVDKKSLIKSIESYPTSPYKDYLLDICIQ